MASRNIHDCSLGDLEDWCAERDLPGYRAAQVTGWLYRHGARDFGAMSNLAPALRTELAACFDIGALALAREERSDDGTRKLLFRLRDGATIESVLIPD